MRSILLVSLIAVLLVPACAAPLSAYHYPDPAAPLAPPPAASDEGGKGKPFLWVALLYLPNRVLDLFDLVRFGVDVGPGVGGQLKATDPVQLRAMFRLSAGLGFQGFRHLPVQVSTEVGVTVGPADIVADPGLVWYESPTDIRIFAHVLLLGAHVAIDPVEWLDFPLGFVLLDPADDDF